MKCPRCGLIHPAGDEVCRRCEIDLRTGEPRSRAACVMLTAQAPGAIERLRGLKLKVPARIRTAPPPEASGDQAVPAAVKPKPKSGVIAAMRRPQAGLLARLKFRRRTEVKNLTCVQCSGLMEIDRQAPFSPAAPVGLLVLAGVLFVAGFKFHLLFITAIPAAILGLIYLRVGKTSWKCHSCGFTIPRTM
jgi:hypothetical protein